MIHRDTFFMRIVVKIEAVRLNSFLNVIICKQMAFRKCFTAWFIIEEALVEKKGMVNKNDDDRTKI